MSKGEHDTLVYRLSQMLIKLNQGEKLAPQTLASEFGVNVRTIQRDLNVRFAYLPLRKIEGKYELEPFYLGKLSRKDIDRFASLAGVKGLFPSLNDDFFREIFDSAAESELLVKGHNYEDWSDKIGDFDRIKTAILEKRHIRFDYQKSMENKHYPKTEPYKLLNHHGIWYLVAVDAGKIKTFAFSKVSRIQMLDSQFSPDPSVNERLHSEDGIWFSQREIEVKLKIAKEIAGYFKRRKLITNQVIEDETEDGSLILSTKVGHFNQVLPIIKYWIPHIIVVTPQYLTSELNNQLKDYLKE